MFHAELFWRHVAALAIGVWADEEVFCRHDDDSLFLVGFFEFKLILQAESYSRDLCGFVFE